MMMMMMMMLIPVPVQSSALTSSRSKIGSSLHSSRTTYFCKFRDGPCRLLIALLHSLLKLV